MRLEIKELGPLIRMHRKIAGLSQKELAELAGIGKTVVFDVENGKETIKVQTLSNILETLNISIEIHSPLQQQVGR